MIHNATQQPRKVFPVSPGANSLAPFRLLQKAADCLNTDFVRNLCPQGTAANRAWGSAHAEGQQGMGHPFWPEQLCSTAPRHASTEQGQAQRVHTRAVPGEKLGVQKPTIALGLLQPGGSQHLQCCSNQRSQKRPLRIVLSGRRKGWLGFPTPHLVARAIVITLLVFPTQENSVSR